MRIGRRAATPQADNNELWAGAPPVSARRARQLVPPDLDKNAIREGAFFVAVVGGDDGHADDLHQRACRRSLRAAIIHGLTASGRAAGRSPARLMRDWPTILGRPRGARAATTINKMNLARLGLIIVGGERAGAAHTAQSGPTLAGYLFYYLK